MCNVWTFAPIPWLAHAFSRLWTYRSNVRRNRASVPYRDNPCDERLQSQASSVRWVLATISVRVRSAEVIPENVAMEFTGHKTRPVFQG